MLRIIGRQPVKAILHIVLLPERRILQIESAEIPEIAVERIVNRVFQQHEILLPLLIPLAELCKFIAHEVQLLARMQEHIQIQGSRLRELSVIIPGHLLDDRRLPMDHLVMGERKQISLVVEISHREGQLVILLRAVGRIGPEEIQRVVHPAHIPLVVKAQAALRDRFCDPRIRRRVLCNQHCIRIQPFQPAVHLLQEFDGIRIDPAPLVPHPVDQIADRVKSQSIEMILIQPESAGGIQKACDIASRMVEVAAPPLTHVHRVIGVFIQLRPIVAGKRIVIGRKMDGHDVQDHADIRLMEPVHQLLQAIRRTIARGRAEKSGRLVPPGLVRRVFIERHELHRIEMIFLQIRDKEICNLLIPVPAGGNIDALPLLLRLVKLPGQLFGIIPALPGAQVKLIDVERPVEERRLLRPDCHVSSVRNTGRGIRPDSGPGQAILAGRPGPSHTGASVSAPLHVGAVTEPVSTHIPDDGSRLRAELGTEGIRIGMVVRPGSGGNLKLIHLSRPCLRNLRLEKLSIQNPVHRSPPPAVELPDHRYLTRRRRISSEHHA